MQHMKHVFLSLGLALVCSLSACASAGQSGSQASDTSIQSRQSVQEPEENLDPVQDSTSVETVASDKNTLVVYFSATGTTKSVAEKIAAITGADLYEILAAEEYTSEDLDWNDKESRTTIEQNDASFRPEIGSEDISLEGYSTVYIGYPIWWGEEPRIMDTFVENHDFDGITVIPFCTSGSSSIGNSGNNLAGIAGTGNWLEGNRFSRNTTEDELQSWISSLQ